MVLWWWHRHVRTQGGKKEGGGKDKKAGSDVPMPTSKDVVPVNFYKGKW